jgi:hypothetical protein
MTSLHIEHAVTDLDQWIETFSSFSEVRAQGGVTATRVRRAVDEPNHVAVDLDFETVDEARSFLELLETKIWPGSPFLAGGTPQTSLLEPVTVRA